jgi:hypothetical protein
MVQEVSESYLQTAKQSRGGRVMSRSCKECAHHNPDFIDEVCLHCSWPEFAGEPSNFKPKPITNADRIRAMTDEELAEFLWDVWRNKDPFYKECVDGRLVPFFHWLKQEVEK